MPQRRPAYLSPLGEEQRIDLDSSAGRDRVLADLHPKYLASGHWLAEPGHTMSRMQQFAINNVVRVPTESGLFSVNCPPGTGKTTLLRDVFADNVVQRARQLANCKGAMDAFVAGDSLWVAFDDENKKIVRLKPELTGFEMVVASSNNVAVENISGDLPKTKSLGDRAYHPETKAAQPTAWRYADGTQKVTYLQSVAQKVLVKAARNRQRPLPAESANVRGTR